MYVFRVKRFLLRVVFSHTWLDSNLCQGSKQSLFRNKYKVWREGVVDGGGSESDVVVNRTSWWFP